MFELNGKVSPNAQLLPSAAVTQIPPPNSLTSSLPLALYVAFLHRKDVQALTANIRAV